jgi:hypothetical protein
MKLPLVSNRKGDETISMYSESNNAKCQHLAQLCILALRTAKL